MLVPRAVGPITLLFVHLYRKTGRKASDARNNSALPDRRAPHFLSLDSVVGTDDAFAEEVMKAILALIVIYVGAFLLAIQGTPSTAVEAAPQSASGAAALSAKSPAIDPLKEVDIRLFWNSLELMTKSRNSCAFCRTYCEKLLATVPNNDRGQSFVNAVISDYEKRYDVDQVTERLVLVYDKHYSEDEIKGLLQFYGSPLGQKVALEAPKISREIQEASRATAAKAVRESLQQAKQENPAIGQNAHLVNAPVRRNAEPKPQDLGQQVAGQVEP